MALSKKKVESFTIGFKTLSEEKFDFEEMLSCDDIADKNINIKGKYVSLKILENDKNIIVGIVETSRDRNIPPKKNRVKKKVEKIGLNTDEGLAYANVFIYEKKRKILMYEVNKSGCFVDHFLLFIYRCFKKHNKYKSFDIKIDPILKADEYSRMLRMSSHKSIEVYLANPAQIIADYEHENDALLNICRSAVSMGSTRFKSKFDVEAKRQTQGLLPNAVQNIVDSVLKVARSSQHNNVKKIIVEGYETDSEDNKLQPIDLIADRFMNYIELEEPRENIDLLEIQRSNKIKDLYNYCIPEFDAIFGKN